MNIRLARPDDLKQLQRLEQTYLNDELSSSAQSQGLDGQSFGFKELERLIAEHWIVVAEQDNNEGGEIVGYVIAGGWHFFESWPVYRNILRNMGDFSVNGTKLTKSNSCQYGPIWIKQSCRGQGIFEKLVNHLKLQVQPRFQFMLTFIAEDNLASFTAHTNKASMQVLDFFTFDERDYYLLALVTK
ncbi:GNAT family N-acetyltransferase [uncultured Shewanella sp.]|uniref:GNAT family N-acetyltransferase n=1 Tax=Shewanella atlantica TaxID=271099 RepID=UPI0026225AD0|nr:GNAT family N-acetyltransferase [uncultured Shewanella sp.]